MAWASAQTNTARDRKKLRSSFGCGQHHGYWLTDDHAPAKSIQRAGGEHLRLCGEICRAMVPTHRRATCSRTGLGGKLRSDRHGCVGRENHGARSVDPHDLDPSACFDRNQHPLLDERCA